MAGTDDWFWEGNVCTAVETHLVREGWRIVRKADALRREHGVDLHAERNGEEMLVEVKGFPSVSYRDPRRAGEIKKTRPSTQAWMWYSHALMAAVSLQERHPDGTVAMAFPEVQRYRDLIDQTATGLRQLGLIVLLVSEAGEVRRVSFNGGG